VTTDKLPLSVRAMARGPRPDGPGTQEYEAATKRSREFWENNTRRWLELQPPPLTPHAKK